MSWPLTFKWEGKPQFCSVKAYAPAHNLPPEKELIGTSSILAPGKSQVLPTDPLFTCKTDYIYNLADRRSAIKRQEGGIAALKVCLKALPPFSSLSFQLFCPFPKQRACLQAICCIFQTLQREKRKSRTYTTSEKRHKISKVAIYQNKRNLIVRNNPAFDRPDFVPS